MTAEGGTARRGSPVGREFESKSRSAARAWSAYLQDNNRPKDPL